MSESHFNGLPVPADRSPVIVDAVRTAIGRAHPERGVFRHVRGDDLAVVCVKALLERTGVDPAAIEDVLFGCTQQTMEQGLNVGRLIGLMAGVAPSAGGATINRLCGSSLQALAQASQAIVTAAEDVQVVGGVEHMQHLAMDHGLDINPKLFTVTSQGALLMGVTAEYLAQTRGIGREDQDQFALTSHRRAAAAHEAGDFAGEIVPVLGHDEAGHQVPITVDQCVRPDTDIDQLGALEPVFMPKGGTVTAGNSSPLNDGASALLVMSAGQAVERGLTPMARVLGSAVAGVEPHVMGTGPIPAVQKLCRRTGIDLADVDLIELNEAFAAQSLACVRELGLDLDKVNVRGGAIAIGHPLGASGARITTTLVHAMKDRGARLGIATMCIGLGQGIAVMLERVDA